MEKESKNSNRNLFVVAVLCTLLLGVTMAYAVLSQQLNITMESVTQNSLTWNVGFDTSTTVSPVKTGSASASCGAANVTANNVSITGSTVLLAPGDKCTYHLKIKNTGSIDANLASITPTSPTSTDTGMTCTANTSSIVCDNISYLLTTDAAGTSPLTTGLTLAHTSGTLDVYLVASFTGESQTASDQVQTSASFQLVYNQA